MTQDSRPPRPPSMPASPDDGAVTIGPRIGRMIAAVVQTCGRRPGVTIVVSVALAVAALFYGPAAPGASRVRGNVSGHAQESVAGLGGTAADIGVP